MADLVYKRSFITAFLFVGAFLLVVSFFSGGAATGYVVSKSNPGDRFFWIGLIFVLVSLIVLLKHAFKNKISI